MLRTQYVIQCLLLYISHRFGGGNIQLHLNTYNLKDQKRISSYGDLFFYGELIEFVCFFLKYLCYTEGRLLKNSRKESNVYGYK